MQYRLLDGAARRLRRILRESAANWGDPARQRYAKLAIAAMNAIANDPASVGSKASPSSTIWIYHLRSARLLLPRHERVGSPVHVILYQIEADGTVEIVDFAHERQHLGRAADRAARSASLKS